MKKWLLPTIALLLVLLAGYVAAGPWLAIRGISEAIEQRDAARLARHVDFPALRINLKAQLDDQLVRRAGSDMQSSLFGVMALGVAGRLTGAAVDVMVTPAGISALLQGHGVWKRATGDTADGDTWGPPAPARPLQGARGRYESLSRFTATRPLDDGGSVVYVLSRQGLHWRLTDITLPLDAPQ
ncbi:DUF2939 domain-containing protein [Stenotrophomonas acidaminiphila]|uniref:DUF2939 domain-containing protein n=1 Tax=Stenotrophomonas acidaminiphila TaxID=128780 RepID=UPI0024AD405B|nr:DUF2939 domain-containing protein [Stenotrophomonas acidaminiphila]WHL17537.1 DUF2939 domain-containing protein [Stenotrophomonas acidaminiphila]